MNLSHTVLKGGCYYEEKNKKLADVMAYELQYATSKKGLSSAKTIKVSVKKTTYKIGKLKSKIKYHVRIHGRKEYSDILGNKQTVYGKWVTLNAKTK